MGLLNYACKSICVSPKKKRKPSKWHSNSKSNNWNVPTRNKKPPFVIWAKEVMPSNGTLNPIDTVYGSNTDTQHETIDSNHHHQSSSSTSDVLRIPNTKRLIQIITINHH